METMLTTGKGLEMHSTTILAVRKHGKVAIASDGQVTQGSIIIKGSANKIRKLAGGNVVAGFAGATADAFTLFERLEGKLEAYPNQLARACVELAKDWRMDRYLRRLEAMMAVADKTTMFCLSGAGDVLEPEDDIIGIGSGGPYALSAARALAQHTDFSSADIVKKSMDIAGSLCVYTNHQITLETL